MQARHLSGKIRASIVMIVAECSGGSSDDGVITNPDGAAKYRDCDELYRTSKRPDRCRSGRLRDDRSSAPIFVLPLCTFGAA